LFVRKREVWIMESRTLSFTTPAGEELNIPYFEERGVADGPTLTLLGGIHGCEYTSQLAVRRFMTQVNGKLKCGRVRAAPTLNLESFYERAPFVCPSDGLNLNRCFPGEKDSTSYAKRLAFFVTERLIKGSDYLIDPHAGDLFEDLHPFSLYEASPVQEKAKALALLYGLPYCVRQQESSKAVDGSTSSTASALSIPSITAESGRLGIVEEEAVRLHLDGLVGVALGLEMLDALDHPPSSTKEVCFLDGFTWIYGRDRGWWTPAVCVGQKIVEGEVIGNVTDLMGEPIYEVRSPSEGVVLFLTSSPAIKEKGLLMGIGKSKAL
jgi:predicted deacylase